MSAVTAAPAEPAPAAAPRTVRRLRPGVAVTPLRSGLHLRGRRGSVTLEGSTALPSLWRLLEEPLRVGGVEDLLDGMEPDAPLRAALDTLLGQLAAHDLLVAAPAGPAAADPVAQWIAVTAQRPAAAAAALATTRAEVVAGAPDTPLAGAAGRALARGGLPVSYTVDPDLPAGRVLLYAHGAGPGRGVAAGLCGERGYATAPASAARLRSDAAALEARLGPPAPAPAGSTAFVSLLAGAAAHRLLCSAAGLPDPAHEGEDERLLPGLPAVLLADARPLRAEYRTWPGPGRADADRPTDLAPAATLGEALRRMAALCDARCGVLPEPLPGDLRQLPVPLAACEPPATAQCGGSLVGGAPRLDLARLEVFCRAAELLLGGAAFTVGANPGHARGRALREAAVHRCGPPAGLPSVAEARWAGHPQVRHWWTALTGRLAVAARLEVFRAAPGEEVYRAVVRRSASVVLGDAVEATPGDAAAHAALAAVAAVSAGAPTPVRTPPSGGAVAPLASAGAQTAAWEDCGWTGRWLADTAGREEELQDALHRLTGAGAAFPAFPARAPVPHRARQLADTLRAFGFTVLYTPGEAR
ncbi:hypothetical protein ACFWBF_12880 [Streptomyces sp. NPDC060028]|uniref:hypothetical protein n=1 Tax=Streptomyces sp. NPDC060028 TaxID=3347041 RepID=UPI0036989C89